MDVTKREGMHVSTVSRIFTGDTKHPEDKDLDTIIGVVAKTQRERAELVRARLRDAYKGRYANLVKVIILAPGQSSKTDWQSEISVAPDLLDAIKFLVSLNHTDPEVGRMLIQLAALMGAKQK